MNFNTIWTRVLINNSLSKNQHAMAPQRAEIRDRIMPLIVITTVVLAGAIGFAFLIEPHFHTGTTSSITNISTLYTCTIIPNLDFMYCGRPMRISATDGGWNFTVTISSNSVAHGESIRLVANLTNVGISNKTINRFVKPYINPGVYATNGTELWQWNPPQSTWPNVTITSGETVWQDVSIPTSQLPAGQTYLIKVAPLPISFPSPNNMTFTFRFFVG